jgi:hypothetical protein
MVAVNTVGATGVKCGDIGGGIIEASIMPDGTGVTEPTGILEDRAKMAESSWMPSGMAEATGIAKAIEMNEAIVMLGACWVVRAIGLAEASRMLVVMSIPSTTNNWNIGETLLSSKSLYHQTECYFLHSIFQ